LKALTSKLGYSAAGLTVVAAALVPFVLYGVFTKGFAGLGLHVDEMYTGGPKIRTVQAAGYTIEIHREVSPHMLQRETSFVQLDWKPTSALPSHVSDFVDIDGDGKPDVHVAFDVPRNPKAQLYADIEPLDRRYDAMRNMGKQKFSALIVRVDDAVLVRVPISH